MADGMFSPGELLQGRYRILREIGAGGMGAVYEGENTLIRRRVAIKVMHAAAAANQELSKRFEREAQAAGQIGSDHITEVLDLGELPNGDRFIVMEFLEGEPLSARFEREGVLQAEQLIALIRQVLEGLGAAHQAGIVHRDIKPDNVFILPQKAGVRDFVKLLDFGVSKFKEANDSLHLTRTGAFVGTPFYISPEQASGRSEATALSDLYSVGVMLYQGCTGELPFYATQFNHLIFKIALEPLQRPIEKNPQLHPGLDSIICRAMSRDPSYRFQSAAEFVAALDNWRQQGLGVSYPPEADAAGESTVAGFLAARGITAPGATHARGPGGTAKFTAVGTDPGVALSPGSHGQTHTASPVTRAAGVPTRSNAVPLLLLAGGIVGMSLLVGAGWALLGGEESAAAPPASGESAPGSESPPEEPQAPDGPVVVPSDGPEPTTPADEEGADAAVAAEKDASPDQATSAKAPGAGTQKAVVTSKPQATPAPPPPRSGADKSKKPKGARPDWGY